MSHGHHNMKEIIPSDTELLQGWDGETCAMEIYCAKKGKVRFRPSGHHIDSPPITLTMNAKSCLPVEVIQVFATGTTVSEMYGVWAFNKNG